VAYTQARLDRWGRWLKGRRPRVGIEHIDAELITRYVASCSSYPQDGGTIDDLLGAADGALYRDKGTSKRKLRLSR
jgi:hypothetical protein